MWSRTTDCENLIRRQWIGGSPGSAGQRLTRCLESTRDGLIGWDRLQFGHVGRRVKALEEQLEALDKDPVSADDGLKREILRREIEELLSREEIMWKQRGKAQWLQEGDCNTAYFHARASARRRKNSIFRFRNKEENIDVVIGGMQPRVSDAMNEVLTQPFTATEVTHAIAQMYPYKSPGPDGMSPVFFQKYWHIVGPETASFVLDFLNHRNFDARFNYTYIVLIPKIPKLETMSHFRPISLCNITYKITSKVLASRLKTLFPTIISESQSAFIPGRLITDNVLVAYEINHYLAHKYGGKAGYASLKLDLSKAYDRVEWIFLERVLLRLGFHPDFISLIKLCVSTTSYSIVLSGQKFGYSHPERGLRQGNPLSLSSFCCVQRL
ncbi:UNVERIFIED_CONTAM: LINE-1 retrotransposable element O protein [Sesamum latifolium]|uniref:LINE-1 retrotransposable element O protein n=1 Tax=Sesamum latifolium TaxID=2727402 RepID=A0AAW2TD44_9LAMI